MAGALPGALPAIGPPKAAIEPRLEERVAALIAAEPLIAAAGRAEGLELRPEQEAPEVALVMPVGGSTPTLLAAAFSKEGDARRLAASVAMAHASASAPGAVRSSEVAAPSLGASVPAGIRRAALMEATFHVLASTRAA